MSPEPAPGNVLVIADFEKPAERLCRWIASMGERPVLVSGCEKAISDCGDDDTIDLVVTDLDTDVPEARSLLERFLQGQVLFGVPQLHLFRDLELRDELQGLNPDVASVAMGSPSEASDFQARVRLGTEIGRLRRELSAASIRDELTGSYNRRFICVRLDQEYARARRYRTPLSLVLLEIDQLKTINTRYGLQVGDKVVRHVSEVLKRQVRKEDVCGRWGGKTFAAILPGALHRGAAIFANKVRGDAETKPITVPGGLLRVHVSAGISSYTGRGETDKADDLLEAAEHALLEARKRGGNRVFIDEAVMRRERRVIVLADADPAVFEPAEDLLSMDDYRVLRVESVSTLLETLKYKRPDLLILDMQLEGQRQGDEFVDWIHSLYPDSPVPIIGLSRPGYPEESSGRVAVDCFLTKPFSAAVLRSVARELIDPRRAPG